MTIVFRGHDGSAPVDTKGVLWRCQDAYMLHVPMVFGTGEHDYMAVTDFIFLAMGHAKVCVTIHPRYLKQQRTISSLATHQLTSATQELAGESCSPAGAEVDDAGTDHHTSALHRTSSSEKADAGMWGSPCCAVHLCSTPVQYTCASQALQEPLPLMHATGSMRLPTSRVKSHIG